MYLDRLQMMKQWKKKSFTRVCVPFTCSIFVFLSFALNFVFKYALYHKERKVMLSRFLNFLNRRREKKNFSHGKTQTLISAFIRQVLHPVELCTGAFVFIYSSTFNLQEKCASSDKSTTYSESPGRTGKNVTLRSIASTWLRFLSSIE